MKQTKFAPEHFDVLIVGAGAGRDLLSALVFDQSSIVGVEINANILHVVHDVFGDFSGHLDEHPKITLINDEARSYVARSPDFYDIIQISLIDSWAHRTLPLYPGSVEDFSGTPQTQRHPDTELLLLPAYAGLGVPIGLAGSGRTRRAGCMKNIKMCTFLLGSMEYA